VALNRAIAIGEVQGAALALSLVDDLDLGNYYAFHAGRADLLTRLGRHDEAMVAFDRAASMAPTDAELHCLREPSSPQSLGSSKARQGGFTRLQKPPLVDGYVEYCKCCCRELLTNCIRLSDLGNKGKDEFLHCWVVTYYHDRLASLGKPTYSSQQLLTAGTIELRFDLDGRRIRKARS
jgi:hypothetical protein